MLYEIYETVKLFNYTISAIIHYIIDTYLSKSNVIDIYLNVIIFFIFKDCYWGLLLEGKHLTRKLTSFFF